MWLFTRGYLVFPSKQWFFIGGVMFINQWNPVDGELRLNSPVAGWVVRRVAGMMTSETNVMKYEMDHSLKFPHVVAGVCWDDAMKRMWWFMDHSLKFLKCQLVNVQMFHITQLGCYLQIRFQVIFKIPTGHWPTPVVTALRRPSSYGVVSTSFNGSKRLQFAIETGHLVDLPIKKLGLSIVFCKRLPEGKYQLWMNKLGIFHSYLTVYQRIWVPNIATWFIIIFTSKVP